MSDMKPLETPSIPETRHGGALVFDASKYAHYAQDLDFTEEQKAEFLKTLWSIMSAFVDLGFGVDGVIPALMQGASQSPRDELKGTIPTREDNIAAQTVPAEGDES